MRGRPCLETPFQGELDHSLSRAEAKGNESVQLLHIAHRRSAYSRHGELEKVEGGPFCEPKRVV